MNAVPSSLWRNARLATLAGDSGWGLVEDGALVVHGETIQWAGRLPDMPSHLYEQLHSEHDLGGALVTPGLVDCHSHTAIRGGVNEGSDNVTAEVRIADVIDSRDEDLYRELAGGTVDGSRTPQSRR